MLRGREGVSREPHQLSLLTPSPTPLETPALSNSTISTDLEKNTDTQNMHTGTQKSPGPEDCQGSPQKHSRGFRGKDVPSNKNCVQGTAGSSEIISTSQSSLSLFIRLHVYHIKTVQTLWINRSTAHSKY